MLTSRLRPEQLKEFEQKVQQAAGKFPEEVVRIRHSFGEDWSGDPAIYFRIVLSDEASAAAGLARSQTASRRRWPMICNSTNRIIGPTSIIEASPRRMS
jgi:hypothetical protein